MFRTSPRNTILANLIDHVSNTSLKHNRHPAFSCPLPQPPISLPPTQDKSFCVQRHQHQEVQYGTGTHAHPESVCAPPLNGHMFRPFNFFSATTCAEDCLFICLHIRQDRCDIDYIIEGCTWVHLRMSMRPSMICADTTKTTTNSKQRRTYKNNNFTSVVQDCEYINEINESLTQDSRGRYEYVKIM